jgi:hypothetical protein
MTPGREAFMDRRKFLSYSVVAPVAVGVADDAAKEPRCVEMILFDSQIGQSFSRLDSWAKDVFTPLLAKNGFPAWGCFTLELGVGTPQLMVLIEHESISRMHERWGAIRSGEQFREVLRRLDEGAVPAFHSEEKRLLLLTPFSPSLVQAKGKQESPRYFELRVYHSPTYRQLRVVYERFAGPEIQIFHRVGIHPVLFAEPLFGPDLPNITYLTPFPSLEAREKAWKAFGDDPEWQRVRAESIAKAGDVVVRTHRLIYRATSYSAIQ